MLLFLDSATSVGEDSNHPYQNYILFQPIITKTFNSTLFAIL